MSRLTLSAILLFGLCCIATDVVVAQHSPSIQQLRDESQSFLTGGYSNDQQMALGNKCLRADPLGFFYIGTTENIINLDKAEDFSQVQQDLNINVAASGQYDMFSASASADYARHVEEDNYSEGFYYDEQIQLPTKVYAPRAGGMKALTQFGQYQEQIDPTGQTFRQNCGDQYVQKTPLGAQLLVTFKLNFGSKSERETFAATVSGGVPSIADASASIQQAVSKYNLHGTIDIYALQQGGDVTQLAKIFGDPTCGGHYCVTSCDLNNLEACQGLMDGVIAYAKDNLPSQIDFHDGKIPESAIPLSFNYSPYPNVNVGQTVITSAIVNARKQLSDIYTQQLAQQAFLTHLLDAPDIGPFLQSAYRDQITTMNNDLSYNLDLLEDSTGGAAGCYFTPLNCVAIADQLINQDLKPIDPQLYNQFDSSYSIWAGHPYYAIYLGNNLYRWFDGTSNVLTGEGTIVPITNGLHVDATDIYSHHYGGDLVKQTDGTYQGVISYDDGRQDQQTYQLTTSPL